MKETHCTELKGKLEHIDKLRTDFKRAKEEGSDDVGTKASDRG